jgi:hypothetical protein
MGKGKRLKNLRSKSDGSFTDKASEAFTRNFQKELRNSELWDEIVVQFGEERALEIISECKAEVKTNMDRK